ncbi:MAG TPA: acyl-CoA dehydratase activase [Syntrophorhabdaceae bacterium]|nr:acyl-CoA dehydratase activase [Syntrophorhabdaceae bacterium]HOT41089.1 acyl-CoA dehydratase activase [Syntrophorhabdaceae bacterium]HPC66208.1 acyl-CoA dehydratase activase [Syntrophorhabdaceae bacterium]HQE79115.1 acyl-CoA dehydratase activase [Syntrophorhabdaceae bacterium]HQH42708.1 acyl-CoA dehydratase activase [Syntrophorhabdaceae bacterium]
MYRLGIDIGSVSINLVLMDDKGNIIHNEYIRHKGRPVEVARDLIEAQMRDNKVDFIAATGTGAKMFASLIGATFVNEIVALTRAFNHLYPDIRSVIDIGGEDSKLIIFEDEAKAGRLKIKDFSMNALCAAGTGSFLDQQASRLRFTIEEFSEVALKSKNPPRIAGRCTVFAKSDMIHLQQIATPDYEIVSGLCYALARNFKSNVAKGKAILKPVAFVGGVAANAGMIRAIKDVFALKEDEFLVPEYFTSMGALGAIYTVLDEPSLKQSFVGFERLNSYLIAEQEGETLERLVLSKENIEIDYHVKTIDSVTDAYLGVDVGSISTNLVVIDKDKNVLAKRYLMTEGRPLEAVKKGLAEIGEEIGNKVNILGAGTTGSGRYLTADFIGADIVRNEITAQAEAAINIDPHVDTIFEIGGQDSKYISIDNGVVVDFEMNKACAAGTGSFLEEQAERLGISIKEEFGKLALSSDNPLKMGERCTVFIESDLVHHQQRGAKTDDLVSGLSYSIVANYLNKVVGDRRIGKRIFFQGGTAFNKGVVAAFESTLKRPIKVPPHHDVTGAIGVAILAMKERNWDRSTFKGFDLSKRRYEIETFECKGCENLCEIRKVTVEKEAPLYYGSRCEKYDVVRRVEKKEIEDLFKVREDLLFNVYNKEADGDVIGIPRILNMHELIPFWKAFLTELGFKVVFSDATNKKIIREGVENIIVESCFPIKLAHGHILNLINKGIKNIFIPSVINFKSPSRHIANTFACPYAQSIPYTVKASIDFDAHGVRVLSPVVYFGLGEQTTLNNLKAFGKTIKKSASKVKRAFNIAKETQALFYERCLDAGRRFLSSVKDDEKVMAIIGRPYNSCDAGANLNIHKKLIDLGVKPVPLDMLPLMEGVEEDEDLRDMYWGYGQRILRAAKIVKRHDNFYGVYITNFGCGPDSFITHFFKKTIKGKPFLQLEIDEHSADAGIITRLEAFLDSIKNAKIEKTIEVFRPVHFTRDGNNRRVYIPYMCDHSIVLSGAFRACGVDAEVMGESNESTVVLGRKFTTGKECYPCILTTGDMIRTTQREDFDPEKSAFFMPSGAGPCRFGQYNRFHRMVLDELGFNNVPIYAPNQDHRFYDELHVVGDRFSRLGWRAIVATDLLIKLLHETRPFEVNKGETDRLYEHARGLITESIERGGDDLEDILKDIVRDFLNIRKTGEKKPIVGIVGEIYIRSNRFSNNDLVRKVEEFGGMAWLAPVAEWITYVNYMAKIKSLRKIKFSNLFNIFLTDYYQKKEEHRLESIFEGHIKYGREPRIKDIIEKAKPYIHISFEGEAILTVGKSIDFIEKGVSGIINAMPFTCMPGTISSAIMKLLQNRYNIPVINIAFDGQGTTNIMTRLEAFMHQVKENFYSNG